MSWKIVENLPIKIAVARIDNTINNNNNFAFDELLELAKSKYNIFKGMLPSDIPGIDTARNLFKAIGIDPTKRRPSSEALLRRALKNQNFHKVNNFVDIGNWCSLEFMLPVCVYDADKIIGKITVRKGLKGEKYFALNNSEIDFEGRFVLADESGPFGSPMTDSLRTAVNKDSKNIIITIFAPIHYDSLTLSDQLQIIVDRIIKLNGGEIRYQDILSGE
ncbi:MAG: phenylalanine--tRNA ligase beta subunit-related protein [Candidatus Cloacimonetes bacterium]|nr:phenylalanine--tRNA ligase beta subunit-related protein [Candidatus Cloacimonadota bacterium]